MNNIKYVYVEIFEHEDEQHKKEGVLEALIKMIKNEVINSRTEIL